MNNRSHLLRSLLAAVPFAMLAFAAPPASAADSARQIDPTTVEIPLPDNRRLTLDFYGENIFRLFRDDSGGPVRDPQPDPPARMLVEQPRHDAGPVKLSENDGKITISTRSISVEIEQKSGLMKVTDLRSGAIVLEEIRPAALEKGRVTLAFKERPDEWFYGGGVQNGRFSHKGEAINIVNENSWTDGGVASPNPFYWSTKGYGMLWHTFDPGNYDFGAAKSGEVQVTHQSAYLDLFIMVDAKPAALLADFHQLAGGAALLPKFAFYQGHLNAYNRDYWKEDYTGLPFEDGKKYKESQKNEGGIKESLNGEKDNYQFSARAVVDRYAKHDMPLGWVLPNDGYGAGYGQTETLDGNIANLRSFGEYARGKGVEIGLWTQSDLHPKDGVSALLQRDIVKEVRDAGVRVLKTDVAWVGAGYSFGLHGVADAAGIMAKYGNDARPFIISLDGWAGTQRYAGIWTGDQTGGEWEYIRFHIPTYIGSGLSGFPNIGSDMDGIFGGQNQAVNVRDYQWKTFTPLELNMDGWGAREKYPQALGEPGTSINRWYLKLKSELLPYTYSIAREAVDGLPMVRAMMLDDANEYTLGKATRYQFMYGPNFLVAPIYRETRKDIRNGIYLPEGNWIDWFTGEIYTGGRIVNDFPAPLWKLPVFVKQGAIIPLAAPNNHVSQISKNERIYEFYPHGNTTFTEYDDDGVSEAYKTGAEVLTKIDSEAGNDGRVTLTIHEAKGDFAGFVKVKSTELRINTTARPSEIMAMSGGARVKLTEAKSPGEFNKGDNLYYYEEAPNLNRFATPGSELAKLTITKNPVLHIKLAPADITSSEMIMKLEGYRYEPPDKLLVSTGGLDKPEASFPAENLGTYTLTPVWAKVANADYYEIEFGGMLYSTIRGTDFTIEDLKPEMRYEMKLRAVNRSGKSDWSALAATTKADPFEFAIKGIAARSTAPDQGGTGIRHLFDMDESKEWHTRWKETAVPFSFTMNLKSVNQLDKLVYLPRKDGGNGTLLKGAIQYSMDGKQWTKAGDFEWQADGAAKTIDFPNHPLAAYLKIDVSAGAGGFGSGREMYVFKVAGSESYIPGDINHDGRIDSNDMTSYRNYTGLRKGDADFEGYISKGDIDGNGRIDAYDISVVATQLEGGLYEAAGGQLDGTLSISTPKTDYAVGDTVDITVTGADLRDVNAFGFALPYNPEDLEFVRIRPLHIKAMEDLTVDRLHTGGEKVLYPTFVNVGERESLVGGGPLFVIEMKARRAFHFSLMPASVILVDNQLNQLGPRK